MNKIAKIYYVKENKYTIYLNKDEINLVLESIHEYIKVKQGKNIKTLDELEPYVSLHNYLGWILISDGIRIKPTKNKSIQREVLKNENKIN